MTPSQGGVPELPLGLERHAALLTGQIQSPDDFEEDDFRRTSPRFQGENFRKNLELVERVKEIAAEKGVMPGQLALAWLLHQGEDIVSIPGTKRSKYLEENAPAVDVTLTETFAVQLFSDQETRQMAYWAFEPLVQHLPYVCRRLPSQPAGSADLRGSLRGGAPEQRCP